MITVEYRWPGRRVFEIALVISIVLHLLFWFLATTLHWPVLDLLRLVHRQHETPETIAMSSSVTIEKRNKPAPSQHAAKRTQPRPVQRPQPQIQPVQPQAVQVPLTPVLPKPVLPPPARVQHEIAKLVPHAPPEPPKTVHATPLPRLETAPPRTPTPEKPASARAPKDVALVERQQQLQAANPRRLSQEQIDKIESDLSKTIAQTRVTAHDVLSSVPKEQVAAATTHYAINLAGVGGKLRGAQGLCNPIKSWSSAGWLYYYVSCTVQRADGSVRQEAVPWPVRFRPNSDPYQGTGPANVPLALPLPGWRPDPSQPPVESDLVDYLHERGYAI